MFVVRAASLSERVAGERARATRISCSVIFPHQLVKMMSFDSKDINNVRITVKYNYQYILIEWVWLGQLGDATGLRSLELRYPVNSLGGGGGTGEED